MLGHAKKELLVCVKGKNDEDTIRHWTELSLRKPHGPVITREIREAGDRELCSR